MIKTKSARILEEIRELLNLSIEDFVYQMGWPNTKYYDYIKNGRTRPGVAGKQLTHPTIQKIFDGIEQALNTNESWSEKRVEITSIVIRILLPVK